ncbi:transcriptional regulator TraR [Agrobacterium tumefaciens]|uniref:autoinducer-binding transcriptional regulator TraR n=1 Tax=Agrobacterium tumefaciens TaxID=358 RepID=UPI001574725F|nr:transcriptional regulator TraR [Agrobacterium tumefaciens]NSY99636.1 transcriptional regulator TraR [Agrobacterium tumefaciens]NSZ36389.1 transcriptional regulator TraR [Agrobacterium tumefaciens]NTB21905.1 transcriptional regulator TraR [Agrobacterium tumefaciens]NTB31749.1 transcriptional regulator TraR [Agrobacterium tumefaciens]NTB32230.1 transcriptional regulator TraR [Agrobacterium tumefaciens]
MQHWLDKLTDLAAIPGDEGILKLALATFTEQIGFGGYAYLNIQPGRSVAISNYRQEWQSDYFERGYLAIDPVIRRARSLKRAFTWSGEQQRPRSSKAERSFFAHAADFGIRSGITVPIKAAYGSLAMFTLASEKPAIDLDREIDPVEAASAVAQLHARIALADPTPSIEEPIGLDPKGAAYLSWIAVGKTMEEAAELEGVKYNSVRVKIAEIKKRFDVHTLTHLTAVAIRRKLI